MIFRYQWRVECFINTIHNWPWRTVHKEIFPVGKTLRNTDDFSTLTGRSNEQGVAPSKFMSYSLFLTRWSGSWKDLFKNSWQGLREIYVNGSQIWNMCAPCVWLADGPVCRGISHYSAEHFIFFWLGNLFLHSFQFLFHVVMNKFSWWPGQRIETGWWTWDSPPDECPW